jgi:ABC-type antimicrobial peptide transport system permease subunit
MFLALGALALIVAAIGLYSVIAYNVAQRTHELGVRTALGAGKGQLVSLVVGEGMRFAIAGILIGGAATLALGRWIAPLLFQVSPRDPLVYAVVVVTLLVAALVATVVPGMRAARVNPVTALTAD